MDAYIDVKHNCFHLRRMEPQTSRVEKAMTHFPVMGIFWDLKKQSRGQ